MNDDARGAIEGMWDTGGLVGENFFDAVKFCRADGAVNGQFQTDGLVGDKKEDFLAAYLMDALPVSGLASTVDFRIAGLAVQAEEIELKLNLQLAGVAKEGAINGRFIVEGSDEITASWEAVTPIDDAGGKATFANGTALILISPVSHRFFRARIDPISP